MSSHNVVTFVRLKQNAPFSTRRVLIYQSSPISVLLSGQIFPASHPGGVRTFHERVFPANHYPKAIISSTIGFGISSVYTTVICHKIITEKRPI